MTDETIVLTDKEREDMGLPSADRAVEVKVEKADEKPKAGEPEVRIVEEGRQAPTAEAGIDDLKRQLQEKEREASEARALAQQEAARRQDMEQRAKATSLDANYQKIVGALERVANDRDKAKEAYQDALERGDYAGAADAQQALTRAEFRIGQLEYGRDQLAQQTGRNPGGQQAHQGRVPDSRPAPPPQQQRPPANPVETFLAQLSPRSQTYLRDRMDYVTDPKKNAKMTAAHYAALSEDHVVDSDAYFQFIDRYMGNAKDAAAPAPRVPDRVDVSAPVSRSAPSLSTGKPQMPDSVTITPAEREMAESMDMTINEYARYKAQLIAEGKLNR